MFSAATLKACGIVSWHATWFIVLGIYCLNICRLSLHWGEATSSSVSWVMGSSYVHWDWVIVPAMRCVRGVILWVSSLIEGPVCISISVAPLVVRGVVVSTISQIVWAWWAVEASIVE